MQYFYVTGASTVNEQIADERIRNLMAYVNDLRVDGFKGLSRSVFTEGLEAVAMAFPGIVTDAVRENARLALI